MPAPYVRHRKIKVVMQSLKKGNTLYNACEAAGISTFILWFWSKKYPRLRMILDAVRDTRVQLVEDAQYQTALKGNPQAQMFFLCNRAPDKWKRDAAIQATFINKNEQNVIESPVKKMSDQELDGIISRVKQT